MRVSKSVRHPSYTLTVSFLNIVPVMTDSWLPSANKKDDFTFKIWRRASSKTNANITQHLKSIAHAHAVRGEQVTIGD
jgi:hypothetical protein